MQETKLIETKHYRVGHWYRLEEYGNSVVDIFVDNQRVLCEATGDEMREYLNTVVTNRDCVEQETFGSIESGYGFRLRTGNDEEKYLPDTHRLWIITWPYLMQTEQHTKAVRYTLFFEGQEVLPAKNLNDIFSYLAVHLLPNELARFLEQEKTYDYEEFFQELQAQERTRRKL